jgi:DNA uptake protein ComE-like DNA-binding protein
MTADRRKPGGDRDRSSLPPGQDVSTIARVQAAERWRAITPRPRPSARPAFRKGYLWMIALAGGGSSIALTAAALAPSSGNHVQPIGGLVGIAGVVVSSWVGWYAHSVPTGEEAVEEAKGLIKARARARRIVESNPQLASELAIGRPDLPRAFDDGGLIDVNSAPLAALSSLPGFDAELAERAIEVRESIGGFDSASDLEIVLDLPVTRLDGARDRMIFRQPRRS